MFERHRRQLSDWHYLVFLTALVVMFEHLTEDALVHEENGESLGAKLGATAFNVLLVAIGAGVYPVIWRRVRPVFVLLFGLLAFLGGWRQHATDLLAGDGAGGDYTGSLHALAGIVLIGLAIKLAVDAFRDRSRTTTSSS